MPSFKFVHAADLHLDSPMRGLSRYEGSPDELFRLATREALKNLVTLCLDEPIDFLLIAGDVYDGTWLDYNTGLFFAQQMSRLRAADIPVILIRGNHDAESKITQKLKLPDNVSELSTKKPETKELSKIGVAIHGQGYSTPAMMDDLSKHYPAFRRDIFNVGLLHTSVDGRAGHSNYAPCKLEALKESGYDYWALGHVHQSEILHQEPWIVFPGNIQGRHIREVGAKGCVLVTVVEGEVSSVENRSLDVARWAQVVLNVDGLDDRDAILAAAVTEFDKELLKADKLPIALRLRLQGNSRAHHNLMQDADGFLADCKQTATDHGQGQIWIERVVIGSRPPLDIDAIAGIDSPVGHLLKFIQELPNDPKLAAEIWNSLNELRQKLPAEVTDGTDGLNLVDPAGLLQWLPAVQDVLIPRLVEMDATV